MSDRCVGWELEDARKHLQNFGYAALHVCYTGKVIEDGICRVVRQRQRPDGSIELVVAYFAKPAWAQIEEVD